MRRFVYTWCEKPINLSCPGRGFSYAESPDLPIAAVQRMETVLEGTGEDFACAFFVGNSFYTGHAIARFRNENSPHTRPEPFIEVFEYSPEEIPQTASYSLTVPQLTACYVQTVDGRSAPVVLENNTQLQDFFFAAAKALPPRLRGRLFLCTAARDLDLGMGCVKVCRGVCDPVCPPKKFSVEGLVMEQLMESVITADVLEQLSLSHPAASLTEICWAFALAYLPSDRLNGEALSELLRRQDCPDWLLSLYCRGRKAAAADFVLQTGRCVAAGSELEKAVLSGLFGGAVPGDLLAFARSIPDLAQDIDIQHTKTVATLHRLAARLPMPQGMESALLQAAEENSEALAPFLPVLAEHLPLHLPGRAAKLHHCGEAWQRYFQKCLQEANRQGSLQGWEIEGLSEEEKRKLADTVRRSPHNRRLMAIRLINKRDELTDTIAHAKKEIAAQISIIETAEGELTAIDAALRTILDESLPRI